MTSSVPCDVMFALPEPIQDRQPDGTRILRFHLEPMDDADFLWCDSAGNRGTDEEPSLMVGISLVPVLAQLGSLTPDEVQRGALYLDITLDEVRGFQKQLQRLIDDNAVEEVKPIAALDVTEAEADEAARRRDDAEAEGAYYMPASYRHTEWCPAPGGHQGDCWAASQAARGAGPGPVLTIVDAQTGEETQIP